MFNFSFDRRVLYIVIAILVVISLTNLMTNPGALYSLLLGIPGVLVAITFHEFAHGIVAYKLGDNTAKNEGRLSLNPFAHLDPIGTLMLVFAGFGWGKPPIMNILLAFVFAIIYFVIYKFAGSEILDSTVGWVIMQIIASTIATNVGLGVFNLIPLPPLDGSKIIMPFLPYKTKQWFINNEQIFYLVFIVLWITGLAGRIISPAITWIATGIMNVCSFIL